MDATQFGSMPVSVKTSVPQVITLATDDGSEAKEDALRGMQRVANGLDALDASAESGDEEEEDDLDNDDLASIDSLLEETLEIEELGDETLSKLEGEPDTCTLAEAAAFRAQLRSIGPEEFCRQTVEVGTISAKKLLTAFGVRPPHFLDGSPDDAYYGLLSLAISRELSKRIKLSQYNTVDDAVELIKRSRNIIVLTGAGISTSLGIPDFRSKGTGLYSKLQAELAEYGLNDPQEVFDIEIFNRDPSIFFKIAAEILTSTDRFSPTHAFIHLLQQKGKLLTNYSQNIDNLEAAAGILPEKLIQCHGSFATASCTTCKYQVPGETIFPEIKSGGIPKCPRCSNRLRAPNMKRKRSQNGREKKRSRFGYDSSSDEDYDDPEDGAGVMKPDITFFGEPLPDTFSQRLTGHDKHKVDLVIVIGTSLKVAPVSEVVPYLPAHVPQMYISRDPVSHVNFDVDLLGDCDVVVAELCRRAEWELEHEMIPESQTVNVVSNGSRHFFTAVNS